MNEEIKKKGLFSSKTKRLNDQEKSTLIPWYDAFVLYYTKD